MVGFIQISRRIFIQIDYQQSLLHLFANAENKNLIGFLKNWYFLWIKSLESWRWVSFPEVSWKQNPALCTNIDSTTILLVT